MKTLNKTILATATAFVLTASTAQANPLGYGYGINKVGYNNSFNTKTATSLGIDNSKKIDTKYRLDYKRNNSRRTTVNRDTRLNYRYDYRTDNINANQSMNQFRSYGSNIGQSAGNAGSATGHSMNQSQGKTSVGSLVSESSTSNHKGHNLLSPTRSVSFGSTSKGNMYGSQIGGTQSGFQMGNVVNAQNNDQGQMAASAVSSKDRVSNNASK